MIHAAECVVAPPTTATQCVWKETGQRAMKKCALIATVVLASIAAADAAAKVPAKTPTTAPATKPATISTAAKLMAEADKHE